jgi:hypothetical protein
MEKLVVKYVTGLSDNASRWEKRNHRKYGSLNSICRQIEYDIKHGATDQQVFSILQRIRNDPTFSNLRNNEGCIERLDEIERHFATPKLHSYC